MKLKIALCAFVVQGLPKVCVLHSCAKVHMRAFHGACIAYVAMPFVSCMVLPVRRCPWCMWPCAHCIAMFIFVQLPFSAMRLYVSGVQCTFALRSPALALASTHVRRWIRRMVFPLLRGVLKLHRTPMASTNQYPYVGSLIPFVAMLLSRFC